MSSRFLFNSGGYPLKHFYTTEDIMEALITINCSKGVKAAIKDFLESYDAEEESHPMPTFTKLHSECLEKCYQYITASGLGDWFFDLSKKGQIIVCFRGRRQSFLDGSRIIGTKVRRGCPISAISTVELAFRVSWGEYITLTGDVEWVTTAPEQILQMTGDQEAMLSAKSSVRAEDYARFAGLAGEYQSVDETAAKIAASYAIERYLCGDRQDEAISKATEDYEMLRMIARVLNES